MARSKDHPREGIAACEQVVITPVSPAPARAAVGDGRFPRSGSATIDPRVALAAQPIHHSSRGAKFVQAVVPSCDVPTTGM